MTVFVDIREERSRVPALLEKQGVPITVQKLDVGDYICGDVLVERKDIQDYLGSLVSGHLNQQLYELSFNADLSYLIVEGYISEALMYRKLNREIYYSSLVGSSLKKSPDGKQGQIVTVQTESPFDTALFIKHLYGKVVSGEPRLPRLKKAVYSQDERLIYVLSSFPGIGERKARAILREVKTLRNFSLSSMEELVKVEGIGEKIASTLHGLLNREYDGGVK